MPSSFRILKREEARPDGRFTLEVRPVYNGELPPPPFGEDLEKVREEAEEILARARQQAEEVLRQARARGAELEEEGYWEGYRRGYEEALQQARAEADRIREEARRVLEEARRHREEMLAALEPEVVELAMAVAGQVVHQQLAVAPETVVSVARAALARLRRRRHLVLWANPRDVEYLRSEKEKLVQELGEEASLSIIADPDVSPGGCRVESEGGQVDATLEGQLARLKEALRQAASSAAVRNGGREPCPE
jgi:flagellar assembly protein FliH